MNNLRNLRKQKNLTIVELAEKIGVPKPTVLSWEHGTSQISMGKAKKLAEYFGVSVGYLLGLDTPTKDGIAELIDKVNEERVLGFEIPFENHTRYNNYDDYPISKPTRFSGNIELNLRNEKKSNDIKFQDWTKSYNERSNIPLSLVCEIFEKVYKEFMSET